VWFSCHGNPAALSINSDVGHIKQIQIRHITSWQVHYTHAAAEVFSAVVILSLSIRTFVAWRLVLTYLLTYLLRPTYLTVPYRNTCDQHHVWVFPLVCFSLILMSRSVFGFSPVVDAVCVGLCSGVWRSTMSQLGMVLSEDDVHAMMKSVGIGPYGKISYSGTSLNYARQLSSHCTVTLGLITTHAGGIVFSTVCLRVCLFVGLRDNSRTVWRIIMKFLWKRDMVKSSDLGRPSSDEYKTAALWCTSCSAP